MHCVNEDFNIHILHVGKEPLNLESKRSSSTEILFLSLRMYLRGGGGWYVHCTHVLFTVCIMVYKMHPQLSLYNK